MMHKRKTEWVHHNEKKNHFFITFYFFFVLIQKVKGTHRLYKIVVIKQIYKKILLVPVDFSRFKAFLFDPNLYLSYK